MLDNAHRCAPVRSVTKTVQRRRCTRSPSAHARSRATIGVETLARAPHALPRESCKREEKKAREKESESGERCTVVMSLRAASPTPFNESHRRRTGPGSLGNLGDFERIESRDFVLCTRRGFRSISSFDFPSSKPFHSVSLAPGCILFYNIFPFPRCLWRRLINVPFFIYVYILPGGRHSIDSFRNGSSDRENSRLSSPREELQFSRPFYHRIRDTGTVFPSPP